MQVIRLKGLVAFFAIIGSIYIYLIPPFQAPDENNHFLRLMSITNGNIYPIESNGKIGFIFPESLTGFVAKHSIINGKPEVKYSYWDWYADSHAKLGNEDKLRFFEFSGSIYSPIFYLPQLAGVAMGKLFFFGSDYYNWQTQLYFARLGSLLFTVASSLLVLYLIPTMSLMLFSTLFLPMSLVMSSAVSADPILNCASVIWLACILRLRNGGGINPIVALSMYFSAFVLAHVKVVYSPLIVTLWFVKPSLSKNDFLQLSKGVLFSSLLGILLIVFVFPQYVPQEFLSEANAQKEFLISHPASAVVIPFRSLIVLCQFYFIGLFADFCSLDTNLPFSVVVLIAYYYFSIASLERLNKFTLTFSIYELFLLIGAIGFVIVGMFDATYVMWTSHTKGIGVPLVDGVQGRYFIPLLPYIMLILYVIPIRFDLKKGSVIALNIIYYGFFFHIISILAIIFRFWIH